MNIYISAITKARVTKFVYYMSYYGTQIKLGLQYGHAPFPASKSIKIDWQAKFLNQERYFIIFSIFICFQRIFNVKFDCVGMINTVYYINMLLLYISWRTVTDYRLYL